MKQFKNGQVCTGSCAYCAVTEVKSNRANEWKKRFESNEFVISINKPTTIFNPPPLYLLDSEEANEAFYKFPLELFKSDFVGFCAISDPMLPYYRDHLNWFLDNVPQVAKVVSMITKFPIDRKLMEKLASVPNFQLFVSTTGLDNIEATTTRSRLKTLALAKEYGVRALPVVHPYISGMTNLSFLTNLKKIGYDEVSLKGLRYDSSMKYWMPSNVSKLYEGTEGKETLIEDGYKDTVNSYGVEIISLKDWALENALTDRGIGIEEATELTDKLLAFANITSSDSNDAVREAAIKRRL